MSISANINTDSRGNIIVHMRGGLDYETAASLRKELSSLASGNPQAIITLDMFHVDFVGSSGIGQFVETLNLISRRGKVRMINVKPEFQRVFKLYHLKNIEAMIGDFESDDTMHVGHWSGKMRTFEN